MPMDPLDELITWATEKGVKLNGIKPARMPGRGVGIIATRQVTPGETILEVPTACLRTIDTVSKALLRKLPRNISVHGLLAADLARDLGGRSADDDDDKAPWNAVCPTPADFSGMPLLWPAALQALLPGAARELLAKQQEKLARDWADAAVAFPGSGSGSGSGSDEDDDPDPSGDDHGNGDNDDKPPLSPEDRYRYAWLLVNTRTFYYYTESSKRSSGGVKRRKIRPTDPDSCMCLQPVADLFNHGDDEGCRVAFDEAGYALSASQSFAAGEEVRISYGRHPGDFLLVEYGFAMGDGGGGNRWDEVALDDVVLPRLSAKQREVLDEAGFLGKYVLDCNMDSDTVACYRTQVAVRLLCCGVREWRKFVDGVDDGAASQGKVDKLLGEMLGEYRRKAEDTIREIEGMEGVGEPEQRALLAKRWSQIRDLVVANIKRLQTSDA